MSRNCGLLVTYSGIDSCNVNLKIEDDYYDPALFVFN